jgi:hypothetical protein
MKNYRDLTSSEKAKITRADNKAWDAFYEATDEVNKAFYGFLESNIYPARDFKIATAEEIRDIKIAEAKAECEKIRQEALDWQENHPEVVRLSAIRDAKHKEQHAIRSEKIAKVYKEVGLTVND